MLPEIFTDGFLFVFMSHRSKNDSQILYLRCFKTKLDHLYRVGQNDMVQPPSYMPCHFYFLNLIHQYRIILRNN